MEAKLSFYLFFFLYVQQNNQPRVSLKWLSPQFEGLICDWPLSSVNWVKVQEEGDYI